MDNIIYIYRFWAKTNPYKSLVHHMIDVGCMAKELIFNSSLESTGIELFKILNDKKLIDTIACLAALHDLGKCHPNFQNRAPEFELIQELIAEGYLSKQISYEYRHEVGTSIALKKILKDKISSRKTLNMLCRVLELHHQKESKDIHHAKILDNKVFWEEQQQELFDFIVSIFDADFNIFNTCTDHDAAAVLMWGTIILADWLASGQEGFLSIDEDLDIDNYYKEACYAAAATISNCGLKMSKRIPVVDFCSLWREYTDEMLRPVQRACVNMIKLWKAENKAPGLVIIEAPMGEGKTEAAVYLAAHLMKFFSKSGMYIALPTSATSNQMYKRISSLLMLHGIENTRLLHSMAWLLDDKTPENKMDIEDAEYAMSWLAPLKRGLLAQYAVGTVDQIMMSILKIKYGVLRILGITSKVIVIDEVHAYDTYMYAIIERLLNWCATLAIPIVLLSATLPKNRRKSLIEAYGGILNGDELSESYPLITTAAKGEQIYQNEVSDTFMKSIVSVKCLPLLGKWDSVASLALEKADEAGCICIIVNTVKEAQYLYLKLIEKNRDSTLDILLFHARFPAEDRQNVENICLNDFGKNSLLPLSHPEHKPRPKKAILVATQVVEQSLDLDFDHIITAIAPIDLLLQRIGRLHRHMGRIRPINFQTPSVTVIVSSNGIKNTPTAYIYNGYILKRTIDKIIELKEIHLPEDIRSLVNYVYSEIPPNIEDQSFDEWAKMTFDDDILTGQASGVVFPKPKKESFFAVDNQGIFFDEDTDDMLHSKVRTRIGESQIRIAILPESFVSKLDDHITKMQAKQVLARSVSISKRYVEGILDPIYGKGLIEGILLLPSDTKEFKFYNKDKLITIREDKKLGIIIEEE